MWELYKQITANRSPLSFLKDIQYNLTWTKNLGFRIPRLFIYNIEIYNTKVSKFGFNTSYIPHKNGTLYLLHSIDITKFSIVLWRTIISTQKKWRLKEKNGGSPLFV